MKLFNVNNNIYPLTIDRREECISFLLKSDNIPFEMNFDYLYIMNNFVEDLEWFVYLDECFLCYYYVSESGDVSIWGNIMNRNGESVYSEKVIEAIFKNNPRKRVIHWNYNSYEKDGSQKDYCDFVYSCDDWNKTEGSKFRNIRNSIKRYEKDNDFEIVEYNEKMYNSIVEFKKKWNPSNGDEAWDEKSFINFLDKYNELNDISFKVIINNGNIDGYIVVSWCNGKNGNIFFLNSSRTLGITEKLMKVGLSELHSHGVVYANMGNAGEESCGLYKSKEKLRPAFKIPKYSCKIKR